MKNKIFGKTKLSEISKGALEEAKSLGATQAEVVLWQGSEELTRFANNQIHQSVSLKDAMVHVRVVIGKKIGVSRGNRLEKPGVKGVVRRAYELSLLQREDIHFHGLPKKRSYKNVDESYVNQSHLGALGRARAISEIVRIATGGKLSASGAFSEAESETLVANSKGVMSYTRGKSASLSTILTGEKGSGYGSQSSKGGAEIDFVKIGKVAATKATLGEFVDIKPGDYEVILEPAAVSELMDFFAWLGPNARIYHEDVSFYQGRVGKKVFDRKLTIDDDPLDETGYPVGFDYEGFPKKKLGLVNRGILTGVVYDSYHASKYGETNTGHALLAPNTWGPIPMHIRIKPGDTSRDEMVKSVKRGLLVTRFWYTRVIQHKQLTLTGMTRDGTFYIENGKIVGRVRNLRFTESILNTLKVIKGVGDKLELHGSEGSPALIPCLHLARFRFTGVTEYG